MRERSGNGWWQWVCFLQVVGAFFLMASCGGGGGGGSSTTPPQGSILTVDAGPGQVVLYDSQVPIQLDGSSCSDSEGLPLAFTWAFTLLPQGSGAVIIGADSEDPTFQPDMIGTYEVELTVSNGVEIKTDSVLIDTAGSLDAIAHAGSDQMVDRGASVSLNGGASAPGPGATITVWQWTQVLGPDVTGGAGNLAGETPSFAAPDAVATVEFDLRVDDGTGLSPADRIRVQVMADTANALFVDPASGDDASPGTRDEPMASLTAAIDKADLAGLGADIYLNGDLFETATITLGDGISIYGGFDPDWRRREWLKTRIDVATPTAFRGENLATETELDQLSLRSGDGNTGQPSTIGIHLRASDAVQIRNTTVIAGKGYNGADGASIGERAWDGDDGSYGQMGCEDGGLGCDRCWRLQGGDGGDSHVGRRGGRGGSSGHGSDSGYSGGTGIGGTPGGSGTPSGRGDWNTPSTYWGGNGSNGADGANGPAGQEAYSPAGYAPTHGDDGVDGVHGNGGGGGGGGGGGVEGCDSYGGSGGGGGAGGTGGTGGGGGASGGASIAVYASNCTALIVDNCILLTGSGGDGGDGGDGQPGGYGGDGGNGVHYGAGNTYGGDDEQGDGSNGGRGGNGGAGGRGGDGGGGHGGPVIGILDNNSTITTSQVVFYIGTAGLGGSSSGNSASNGRREEVYAP